MRAAISEARKREIADGIVEMLYRSLPTETLAEMVEIGKKYPPAPQVVALNEALERELDRRAEMGAQA